jgi:pyruvate formate lyase activating enzyme
MKIGGLEKLSLLDYPGNLATIVFTQGCNFRCHFCYNPMLVWPSESGKKNIKGLSLIKEKDLFLFLKSRLKKIDGVVITGGEPTIHSDLPQFIAKIKNLGLLVKLDTNGTNPQILNKLWQEKLIDYVAMDLKAPFEKYELVTGVKINYHFLEKSVKILIEKDIPHEFRSTLLPIFHNEENVKLMGKIILGAKVWYLQKFKATDNLLNPQFSQEKSFSDKKMRELAKIGAKYVIKCQARGLNN